MVADGQYGDIVVGGVQRLEAQAPAIAVIDDVVALADNLHKAVALHDETGAAQCQYIIDHGQ